MSVLSFCEWLNETSSSIFLRESTWAYPIIGTIHILAIALFGGMVAMSDLRLLGLAMRREPVSEVVSRFRSWESVGFVIIVVSGVLLFWSEPVLCYKSLSFWIKMFLMLLVGVNALIFRATVYRNIARLDDSPITPGGTRLAAGISLTLWISLVLTGRGIAFF